MAEQSSYCGELQHGPRRWGSEDRGSTLLRHRVAASTTHTLILVAGRNNVMADRLRLSWLLVPGRCELGRIICGAASSIRPTWHTISGMAHPSGAYLGFGGGWHDGNWRR